MNNVKCDVLVYDFAVPSWNWWRKCPYNMKPRGVVVHNTYNRATAKAEASYMCGNSIYAGFHTVVDEAAAFECVPFHKNTWHCGANYGNRNYIGVEIARSTGNYADFIKAEINAAKYIAGILRKYGWGLDKVYTHQQQSGKYCPHKTLDLGWLRFKRLIEAELRNGGNNSYAVNNSYAGKVSKGGYSVRVNVGDNDVLNVRENADATSRKVSTYRNNSVIYVEHVKRDRYNGAWYKIPNVGYVSAKYCAPVTSTPPKPKKVNKAGYSVKVNVGKGHRLNVREKPTVKSKIVSSYRDTSIIYVEQVERDENNNAWYKIPRVGYVSARFCAAIN